MQGAGARFRPRRIGIVYKNICNIVAQKEKYAAALRNQLRQPFSTKNGVAHT